MKFRKNDGGITLIALVITIIILLILAGITITMLIGENGVLKQANTAKIDMEEKTAEEKVKLIVNYAKMKDENLKLNIENLKEAIDEEEKNGMNVKYKENDLLMAYCIADEYLFLINIQTEEITCIGKNISDAIWNLSEDGMISLSTKEGIKKYKNLIIPNEINGKRVLGISDNCFEELSIESIIIPKTVQKIGSKAFAKCSQLKKIEMPCDVTLGENAFDDCDNISEIVLTISDNSTEMVDKNTAMPWYKTKVGVNLIIREGITKIGWAAFADSGIDGVNHIESVEIPSTVMELPTYAFSGCVNLVNVTISEGLKIIHGCAFQNCERLPKIVLPKSIQIIEDNVFNNCPSLKKINFMGDKTNVDIYTQWLGDNTKPEEIK